MKYFLDSAKLDEIKEAYDLFKIDGLTTNPRHIMTSGKPFLTVLNELAAWVKQEKLEGVAKFPISVEINPHLNNAEDMLVAGKQIASMCSNFVIKVPCTMDGIKASRMLEEQKIRTNLTLVFSSSQALWAGRNNSLFVSPFIGWKEDGGEDCKAYIKDIVAIYKNYNYYGKTEIICAALRTPKQMVDCAVAGADIVTTALAVYKESINHAYTDKGLTIFRDAWDKTAK